jgi:hypothetical protein
MQQRPRPVRRGQTPQQQMIYGLGLAVLGIVLTIVFQFIASATGSSYTVVFYGMTIIGIIYLLVGFVRMLIRR